MPYSIAALTTVVAGLAAVGLAVASVTLVAWVVLVLVSSPNRKRRTVVSDEMVVAETPAPTDSSRTTATN